jgi:putative transposase
LVTLIHEAVQSGCRLLPACKETEVSLRTYRRWVQGKSPLRADQRPEAIRQEPTNKLSDEEVNAILAVCSQQDYASLPPSQIVPKLADQGIYLASESSFYRILHAHDQVHHRGRSRAKEGRSAPTS